MVTLNSKGEIGDFLDINQFIPGKSAYECVAYSASLIYYCGPPGHGPTGTTLEATALAQRWYGKEEGSTLASNTNGMSVPAMENMLAGMGLTYHLLGDNLAEVKLALQSGMPVLLCGAETGMYDLGLGDVVPYSWVPSGNHAIVASGIASDGNLLVHDCANIAPTGVRTGPRTYDAAKLQIVSATAIKPLWMEENIVITVQQVSNYFTETSPGWWQCKNGKVVHGKVLQFYQSVGNSGLNGLTLLGLPVSNEIALDAKGNTRQHFERGVVFFDPEHVYDSPPGSSGACYMAHIYTGMGVDPAIALLQSELAKATQAPQQFAALEQIAAEAASALGKHLV